MTNIVVIGGGIAGNEAAFNARKTDPDAGILIINEEEHPLYSACALADYVCGDITRERLFLSRLEDYRKNSIEVLFSSKVTGWRPDERMLQLKDREIGYDKLIIATGSRPYIPPIPGTNLEGVCTLKTLQDADRLRNRGGKRAVVIGSGPVGIESAIALRRKNFKVSIIEQLHGVLPLLFDRELSMSLNKRLSDRGIDLCLGEKAVEIFGNGKVEGIRTEQQSIPADTVVFAIGMRPEVELAKAGLVKLGRHGGISVDEMMQTSIDDVYACGDCVEYYNNTTKQTGLYMLWNNARIQGRIAGANAAGTRRYYGGNISITNVNVFEVAAASVGLTSRQVPEDQLEVIHKNGPAGEFFLVLQKDRLAGVQAIGCTERVGGLLGAVIRGDNIVHSPSHRGTRQRHWALREMQRELTIV